MYHQVGAVRAVAQAARAVDVLVGIVEELLDAQVVFPGLRECELLAVLVLEPLLVVGVLHQILAQIVDVHVAVGDDAVGVALVGHEVGVVADRVDLEVRLLHVVVERLEQAGRGERRDHVRVDVEEVELRRARQRLRHRALRRVEDRDVLDRADADAGQLLELLHRRLHRHVVVRPDHPAQLGRAERLCGRDDPVVLVRRERPRDCAPRREVGHRETETPLQQPPSRDVRCRHGFTPRCFFLAGARRRGRLGLMRDRRRRVRRMGTAERAGERSGGFVHDRRSGDEALASPAAMASFERLQLARAPVASLPVSLDGTAPRP